MNISRVQSAVLFLLALGFVFPVSNAFAQAVADAVQEKQEMECRAPVEADGQLVWKLREGLTINVDMNQQTNIAMDLGGQNMETASNAVNEMTMTVQSVDAEGVATVSNVIDRMVIGTKAPMGSFEFDSDKEDEPEGPAAMIGKMIRPMVGQPITQKMSSDGKIFDVSIPEGVLDGIQNANPQMAQMFSEKTLQEMSSKGSIVFPAPLPAVGTAWTVDQTMNMGAMQVTTSTNYVYKGVADVDGKPLHVISGDLKLGFPEDVAGAAVEVGDQDAQIVFFFDGNAGMMVKSELNQNVQMQISAGNQKIDQNLTQTMTMNMTVAE